LLALKYKPHKSNILKYYKNREAKEDAKIITVRDSIWMRTPSDPILLVIRLQRAVVSDETFA